MNSNYTWKESFHNKKFVISFILIIISLIITLIFLTRYLLFVESRPGFSFDDPILRMFNAVELNWFIFPLIYLSIISGFYFLIKSPKDLFIAISAYLLLVWVRILFMYVLPLNPPIGTIDLKDPLIFVIGVGQKITKDLFFSGHTSTVFLIFLSVKNKKMKIIFLIAAILVGLFMMIQKAHYSVDVFVAPFVAFGVYKISEKIFSKSFQI
jgi:hypothetical protein